MKICRARQFTRIFSDLSPASSRWRYLFVSQYTRWPPNRAVDVLTIPSACSLARAPRRFVSSHVCVNRIFGWLQTKKTCLHRESGVKYVGAIVILSHSHCNEKHARNHNIVMLFALLSAPNYVWRRLRVCGVMEHADQVERLSVFIYDRDNPRRWKRLNECSWRWRWYEHGALYFQSVLHCVCNSKIVAQCDHSGV